MFLGDQGSANDPKDSQVALALKEMTNVIDRLVKRVASTEQELKMLKDCASSSGNTSSSSSSRLKVKHTVLLIVRVICYGVCVCVCACACVRVCVF